MMLHIVILALCISGGRGKN